MASTKSTKITSRGAQDADAGNGALTTEALHEKIAALELQAREKEDVARAKDAEHIEANRIKDIKLANFEEEKQQREERLVQLDQETRAL